MSHSPFNRSSPWRRRLRTMLWSVVMLTMLAALWWANRPGEIAGTIVAISDGDSFILADDGERRSIRLSGIDAPELRQSCATANGAPWPCGTAARAMLKQLLPANQALTCRTLGTDNFSRTLSRCVLPDGRDVAAEMVGGGLAVATNEDYQVEESAARQRRSGVWQGAFLTPAEWRAANPRSNGAIPRPF